MSESLLLKSGCYLNPVKRHFFRGLNQLIMNKPTINYVVDAVQSLLLLFLLVTGIIQGWIIQQGLKYKGGRGTVEDGTFLGIDRHTLVTYHKWVAVAFVVLVIVHLVLHWGWITGMSRRIFAEKHHP